MNNRFEILEHKADLKIRVKGKTLSELFNNAAFALAVSQKGDENFSNEKIQKEIKIKASDANTLLVDFLNELLYLSDTEELVFPEIEFKKINEKGLEAVASGYKYDNLKIEIKAATFHGLEIKKEKEKFSAEIIFDI